MKENCKRLARRTKLCSLVKPALLLTGMLMLVWMVCDAASGQYRWQWYRAWRYVGVWEDGVFYPGVLLQAIQTTLLLSALSMVFAIVWGGILAWMRLCASPVARAVSAALLGVLRNTPLLMQMFMVYFVVAPVLGASPFWAATFALAAFEGAYLAEIFRAGVLSIAREQWEAAYSLGMPLGMAVRHVVLPQAVTRVLPPLAGQMVSLIKDTSLVSAISVADLTMRARVVITETFLSFEVWLLTAALYLMLTLLVSVPAKILERKEEA